MATKDDEPELYPAGKVIPADATRREDGRWNDIIIPTSGGLIRTTFWNVVRYRSAVRQMQAYKAAVLEYQSILNAQISLNDTRIEHARSVARVANIAKILEQDRIQRDLQWRAQRAKAEAEAELAEQELERVQTRQAKDGGDKPKKKTAADRMRENAEARRELLVEKEKLIRETKEFWKSHGFEETYQVVIDAIQDIENQVFEEMNRRPS
jgi:hypothetical protein